MVRVRRRNGGQQVAQPETQSEMPNPEVQNAEQQNGDAVLTAIKKAYPQDQCYKCDGMGHYIIHSYSNHPDGSVTLQLAHGRDSFLPGYAVFGIDLSNLSLCGCGKWEKPTREQLNVVTLKQVVSTLLYMFENQGQMTAKQKREHVKEIVDHIKVALGI